MLSHGKAMEIAEHCELTHSYSTTAQPAVVDPKTVRHTLARRTTSPALPSDSRRTLPPSH